jgi:hypothetical protein
VVVRQVQSRDGRRNRFVRSTTWQAYYVEATIVGIVLCVLALRALEYAYEAAEGTGTATALHYPLTGWLGEALTGLSPQALADAVVVVAALKIVISMAWFVVIGLTPTMGIAWHRFTAPFNIFLKRHADGRTSLGAVQPIMVDGVPVDLADADELPEDAALGVGSTKDLTWKNLLDLTTCTECGRCQDQCPAWQTEKPLSPKLLITALRPAPTTTRRTCWQASPRRRDRWWGRWRGRRLRRPRGPGRARRPRRTGRGRPRCTRTCCRTRS